MYEIHHYNFERVVARLFSCAGYNVTPTKRTRDGGYDMIAVRGGVIPTSHLIECKSTQKEKKVGIDVIERFIYKVNELKASTGIVVTNYKYSLDVLRKFSTQAYKYYLKLIDGDQVLSMIKDYVNRSLGTVLA
ncbi:restriction endonuclease [Fibrella aquatilis]|nr:restriction endonuclease [Fibrella aquatilis]